MTTGQAFTGITSLMQLVTTKGRNGLMDCHASVRPPSRSDVSRLSVNKPELVRVSDHAEIVRSEVVG